MLGLSLTLSGTVGAKNLWQVKISFFLSFGCILICPNFIYLFVLENYCEEKFYVRSSPLSQSIFICEKFFNGYTSVVQPRERGVRVGNVPARLALGWSQVGP